MNSDPRPDLKALRDKPGYIRPNSRVLHEDLFDICQGSELAAKLLDYFIQVQISNDTMRSQGENVNQWRKILPSEIHRILISRPARGSLRRALLQLVDLGLITPHPDNAQFGKDMDGARNPGGTANRFRINTQVVIQAQRDWQSRHANKHQDPEQIEPPTLAKSDQGGGQIYQGALSNLTDPWTNVTGDPYQENQVNQASSSSSAEMTTMTTLIQLFTDWKNRKPTGGEVNELKRLAAAHGETQVAEAIGRTITHGGENLSYIRSILLNGDAPKPGTPAPRKAFVAPEDTGEAITAEAMRAMRRDIEARRRLSDGGAS